jgi:hypothetical protein
MARVRVPSPEEIQAIVDARERGVELAIPDARGVMQEKVSRLERQVESLATRGKMTAAEMREALVICCQRHNFMPADELARMVMERGGDGEFALTTDQRIRVLSQLNKYIMPELKSVEVAGTVEHNHTINIIRYGEDGRITKEEFKDQPMRKIIDAKVEVSGA